MKHWHVWTVAGLFAFSLGLVGCDSHSYSDAVVYQIRTDPLVLDDKLGDETYEPVRPGIFPILSFLDLIDPRNPLHGRGDQLTEENKLRDPTLLGNHEHDKAGKADRQEIIRFLDFHFGTPAQPRVLNVSEELTQALKIDGDTLARGSSAYRIHCLHCHGVTGDGRGPTAKWVNPQPRDYRQGLFKFQSTDQADGANYRAPSRDDLLRVLRQGIEGTAMPSFVVLPPQELEALVSYVIHLSMRGQVEYRTFKNAYTYDKAKRRLNRVEEDLRSALTENLDWVADNWLKSQTKRIKVPPMPFDESDETKMKASVQRGQRLFLGAGLNEEETKTAKKADCKSCHIDYGRRSKFRYDSWGTLVRPNNLVQGVYRGGRRPVDFYQRIHSGINGANMNIFGADLSSTDIWDLVNFVQVLPYPAMRQKYGVVID